MKSLHRPLILSFLLIITLIQSTNASTIPQVTPAPHHGRFERRQGGFLSPLLPGRQSETNKETQTTPGQVSPPPTPTPPTTTKSDPTTSAPTTTKDTTTSLSTTTTTTSQTTSKESSAGASQSTTTESQKPTKEPQTSISTGAGGETVVVIVTPSADPTTSPTGTGSPDNDRSTSGSKNTSSGISTGTIIGLSVAGGIALLALVGFFAWKFMLKKRNDYDDNEAIKWPELNEHTGGGSETHPLPVNSTGRSGFDTSSQVSLNAPDAYSVPPLPHVSPNQPYRDDPNAMTGYYDPYRGPASNSFEGQWGEAHQMNQMGPGASYDMGRASPAIPMGGYDMGRASPAPQMMQAPHALHMMQGRASPAPNYGYGQH